MLSPNPPSRACILGAGRAIGASSPARARLRIDGCAPSRCSSPPSAHLAPHPNLRRPIGGSGLSGFANHAAIRAIPLDRLPQPLFELHLSGESKLPPGALPVQLASGLPV